jgi:CBS domain-containing protein
VSPIGPLIHDLYQPIKEFLHIRSTVEERVNWAKFPNPEPLVVKTTDTMSKVLDEIVSNKVHRVFMVDDQGRPSGVISLCDIIARFLERSENPVK